MPRSARSSSRAKPPAKKATGQGMYEMFSTAFVRPEARLDRVALSLGWKELSADGKRAWIALARRVNKGDVQ